MFKKLTALLLAALMCVGAVAMTACSGDGKEAETSELPFEEVALDTDFEVPEDFKIGFIFLHDENSTYDKNFIDAANRMKEALGLKDSQVLLKVNVEEGAACADAARDLVSSGCDIVFADSFGHEPYMIEVANEFPNVEFCHATGTKAHTEGLANFHNAFADIYQGRFLAGVAAGMKLNEMIKDGKIKAEEAVIGYVGAFPYAEVVSGYTSFFLGARMMCESATMKVRYTNSWYNEAEEKAAAEALINNDKCVLISQHADSMGAPTACEVAGVPNVSYNGSTVKACPETFIISSAINWTPYFVYIVEQYVNGEAIAADWCGGIEEGSVVLSSINLDVAAEGTLAKIRELAEKIQSGELKVFDIDTFTVDGKKLETYLADVDDMGDYKGETEAIKDGYFNESGDRSAPYFDLRIDGITELTKAN